MIKLFIKLSLVFSILLTSIAKATLLPIPDNLTSNDYIVHNFNGINYDIAWASKVNSERWYFDSEFNTLFAPEIRTGWGYADLNSQTGTLDVFSDLSGSEILALFTDSNDEYIQAFEYWNSEFSSTDEIADILAPSRIRSEWVLTWDEYNSDYMGVHPYLNESHINNIPSASYDTFYIRVSQVPEPSTLMIFSLGLIALASKKRLFS